jgi:hypothetical protein
LEVKVCVIFVADKKVRPTDEMIRLGAKINDDGAGAAWREDRKVKFVKGLSVDELVKLNKELPFPYVIHLRSSSPGTAEGPEGCHPFPVDHDSSLALKGTAPGGVLFHNGFWNNWKDKLVEYAIKGSWPLPDGPWTDSRGLAVVTSYVGAGFLTLLNERVIWFRPNDIKIFGQGWVEVNDVICSNKKWLEEPAATGGGRHHMGFMGGTTTGAQDSTKHEKTGGSSQQTSFRGTCDLGGQAGSIKGLIGSAKAEGNQQKEVQSGNEETVRQGVAEHRQQQKLILFPNEHMCQDCNNAVAKFHTFNPDYHRCFYCHREFQLKAGKPTGEAFVPFPVKTVKVGRCQYCYVMDARHVVDRTGKLICQVCWHKNGKPANTLLPDDDARLTKEVIPYD